MIYFDELKVFVLHNHNSKKTKKPKEAFIFTCPWALSSNAISEIKHEISPNDIKGPLAFLPSRNGLK